MNYADRFNEAEKKGKTNEVSSVIYKFEEEGQTLVGELVAIEPFRGGDFDTEVNQYVFDTDGGRVSTILGSAADKQMHGVATPGTLFKITFRGKKELKEGRRVNLFEIKIAK